MDWFSHLLKRYIDHSILGGFNVNLAEQGEPKSAAFLEFLETWTYAVDAGSYSREQ